MRAWLALALFAVSCGGSASPAATGSSPRDDKRPAPSKLDLTAPKRELCFLADQIHEHRLLHLAANGSFEEFVYSTHMGLRREQIDRGTWRQLQVGAIETASDVECSDVGRGELRIDVMFTCAEVAQQLPSFRSALAELLLHNPSQSFSKKELVALRGQLAFSAADIVPRAHVETFLHTIDQWITGDHRLRIAWNVASYQGRLVLADDAELLAEVARMPPQAAVSSGLFFEIEYTEFRKFTKGASPLSR